VGARVGWCVGGWAGGCERGCAGVDVLVCRPRSESTAHPPSSVAHKDGNDSFLPANLKHLYHQV
jgi:hypothetical protein